MKPFASVDQTIRFAVVGTGAVARLHAKNIQQIGKLLGVCTDAALETEALANEYSAKAYCSFDEMLENEKEIDVVVVCSPVGYHAEHIIKSLQAGKDILCESPLCLTKAAAWQIIETEKYCGQRLYLVQASRFYNPFVHLKKEFVERIEGKIHSFNLKVTASLPLSFFSDIQGRRFPGGGLLYTAFASYIDLLISCFGEVETAVGFQPNDFNESSGNIENYGVSILKMQSGVIGTLHWAQILSLSDRMNTFSVFTDSGETSAQLNELDLLALHENSSLTAKAGEALSASFYKTIYADLLKARRSKDINFPGTLDGAKTVEAIEKIYKALR